jgi:hypothetical protein
MLELEDPEQAESVFDEVHSHFACFTSRGTDRDYPTCIAICWSGRRSVARSSGLHTIRGTSNNQWPVEAWENAISEDEVIVSYFEVI